MDLNGIFPKKAKRGVGMPRFFLPKTALEADFAVIEGEDARHISLSLRMATGDRLTLCDGQGNDYRGRIRSMDARSVTVEILGSCRCPAEMPAFVTLYQCISKGERMDYAVQKAVEAGVGAIVPVESRRCVAKIPPEGIEKKIARWQKIANEAAGQSGRGILPKVEPPIPFDPAIRRMASDPLALLCYEDPDTRPLGTLLPENPPERLSFLIGPEGGIDPNEAEAAKAAGIALCGLGKRILRTESAAPYFLACLAMKWELSGGDFPSF